jgi:hypothetical protein
VVRVADRPSDTEGEARPRGSVVSAAMSDSVLASPQQWQRRVLRMRSALDRGWCSALQDLDNGRWVCDGCGKAI